MFSWSRPFSHCSSSCLPRIVSSASYVVHPRDVEVRLPRLAHRDVVQVVPSDLEGLESQCNNKAKLLVWHYVDTRVGVSKSSRCCLETNVQAVVWRDILGGRKVQPITQRGVWLLSRVDPTMLRKRPQRIAMAMSGGKHFFATWWKWSEFSDDRNVRSNAGM